MDCLKCFLRFIFSRLIWKSLQYNLFPTPVQQARKTEKLPPPLDDPTIPISIGEDLQSTNPAVAS